MATRKRCSGTVLVDSWVCPNPGCSYGIQLFIDGSAITNNVSIDCSMSASDMQALLAANTINGFAGTISVSISGAPTNQISITISNVVLPTSAAGSYSITVTNPGGPCAALPQPFPPTTMTCSVIPTSTPRRGGVGGLGFSDTICFSRNYIERLFPGSCREGGIIFYSSRRIPYIFSHLDQNGNCCFVKKK